MDRIWNPRYECLPGNSLRRIQEQKLLRQIRYVYNHSTFYRKKFDRVGLEVESIQQLGDLKKIPLTTAEELRAEVKQGTDPWGGNLCVAEEKILFCFSPPDPLMDEYPLFTAITGYDRDVVIEHLLRQWAMLGIEPDYIVQSQCWGWEPLNVAYLNSYSNRYLSPSVADVMKCISIPLEIMISDVSRTVHSAKFFRPQILFTNIENIDALEKEVENQKLFLNQLGYKTVVAREREKILNSEQRSKIANKWNADVFSMLDIQEALFYVTDCLAHRGLHVWEDAFLVEVIGPEGERVEEPGKSGKLALTNLFAEATPLIRYQTDIEASIDEDPCICGRTGKRLII